MTQDKGDKEYWANLLIASYHAGIDTIHSSVEYETYPILLSVLKLVAKLDSTVAFKHIVKLAEPHFSNSSYSSDRLEGKIQQYLDDLGVNQLESVQWMWRSSLPDDHRIISFVKQYKQISDDIKTLKQDGLIKSAYCFPYSVAFMEKALELNIFDGFCVYRNPLELDYDDILKKCKDDTVISIRPFFSSKELIENKSPIELLNYNFLEPAIKSSILSLSSLPQLNEIKDFLDAKKNF
ncbi:MULTISPECIES: hypothetical protein [Psychrobacter]|uniref:hypothetical protein n=1 Tax=Psychrobacter TaxID=497 RepID=UPI00146E8469|nr:MULTISPECIES: hypothetical protein [Psychrobacter]